MKRLLSALLVLMLAMSFAMAASSQYVKLSPAGLVYSLVGGGAPDKPEYNVGVSYTGYFWGGKAESEPVLDENGEAVPQPAAVYTSASGYQPKRYYDPETGLTMDQIVEETVERETPIKTMGLKLGFDGNRSIENILGSYNENPIEGQLFLGLAFRQPVYGNRLMVYETVGLSAGSRIAAAVASEVGLSADIGSCVLDVGVRFTAGAYLAEGVDFSFDAIKNASFVLTIAPYVGVGVAF